MNMRKVLLRVVWLVIGIVLLWAGNALNNRLVDYMADIIRQCGIAVILAVSLNIVNGLTGQFSIGHAGFMSVGAYAGASITYFVQQKWTHSADPSFAWMLVAMAAGGICAALFGCIVGIPSLRLRGDYLAIVTLGFGEIIRVLLNSSTKISDKLEFMGGATGFSGADGAYSVPHLATFPVVFGTAIVVLILARNLKFSAHGLAFMSIREDEIAADAMGVNTTKIKVTAFVLSAFFAGVGGVLFAHSLFFQPKTFSFILSINYVVMIVLGGTGSITGATLAAIVLTALPEYLKTIQDRIHFKDEYRLVVYALLLVLMMLLRPGGVFGTGELNFSWLRRLLRRESPSEASESEAETEQAQRSDAPTAHSMKPAPAQAMDASIILDAVSLTRRFGGLVAVGDVNIRLKQGELVGLIGPNGAGKTTVFNLLTGVYEPSEGRLEFAGAPLAGDRPYSPLDRGLRVGFDALLSAGGGWIVGTILSSSLVPFAESQSALNLQKAIIWIGVLAATGFSVLTSGRRHRNHRGLRPFQFAQRGISRTFQNIRLFSELTVLENVRIGTYLRRRTNLFDALFRTGRMDREEAENIERARELLSRFNLARVENEQAKNLPYGDQRRLEIVRALATQPKLLLLDEPAAGMNPQEKQNLMGLIRQVRDDFGLTILLIEHDMRLVMGICERIYVLDYGKIIAEGNPHEIRSNPRVIAAYLGEEQGDADGDGIPDGEEIQSPPAEGGA